MDQTQTFVQTIAYGTNLSGCTCLHVRTVIVDMLVRLTWTKHKHSYKQLLMVQIYLGAHVCMYVQLLLTCW